MWKKITAVNRRETCYILRQQMKVSFSSGIITGAEWQLIIRTVWPVSRRGNGAGVSQHYTGPNGKKYSCFRPKTGPGSCSHSAYLSPPPLSWPQLCGQNSRGKQQVFFGELSAVTYRRNLGPSAHLQRQRLLLSHSRRLSFLFVALQPRIFVCLFFGGGFFAIKSSLNPRKALRTRRQQSTLPLLPSGSPWKEVGRQRGPWQDYASLSAPIQAAAADPSPLCSPPLKLLDRTSEKCILPLCRFIIKALFFLMCSFWTAD